jgi:hypothetical protein
MYSIHSTVFLVSYHSMVELFLAPVLSVIFYEDDILAFVLNTVVSQ